MTPWPRMSRLMTLSGEWLTVRLCVVEKITCLFVAVFGYLHPSPQGNLNVLQRRGKKLKRCLPGREENASTHTLAVEWNNIDRMISERYVHGTLPFRTRRDHDSASPHK